MDANICLQKSNAFCFDNEAVSHISIRMKSTLLQLCWLIKKKITGFQGNKWILEASSYTQENNVLWLSSFDFQICTYAKTRLIFTFIGFIALNVLAVTLDVCSLNIVSPLFKIQPWVWRHTGWNSLPFITQKTSLVIDLFEGLNIHCIDKWQRA